jgi:hypothetical protein
MRNFFCLAALVVAALPAAAAPADRAGATAMLSFFEEFCLNRYPDIASVKAGVADRHLATATKQQRDAAGLGGAGESWAVPIGDAAFVLALAPSPHEGCALAGPALDDSGTRAAFDLMVNLFATAHEFGNLSRPPLRTGSYGGKPATLQTIAAAPEGYQRQAFNNLAAIGPDGATVVRLTRELEPRK